MTFKQLSIAASLALLVASCGPKPSGETAETGEAMEAAEATAASSTYSVDGGSSMITWVGYKPTGKHNGTIGITEGSLSVEDGAITAGNFSIDIASLAVLDIPEDDENNGKLKGHLLSPDFFHADSFPVATFEVVSISPFTAEAAPEDKEEFETEFTPSKSSEVMVENPTHMITGNLTMKGTSKSISFPAAVSMTDGGVSAEASFNIDRTEWNLSYGDEAGAVDKAKDKFIYNTVNVGLSLTAGSAM